MMNIELPIQTSTSIIFFIATVVIAYFIPDYPYLRWFAWSAFCWFLALGVFPWIENGILHLPCKRGRGGKWVTLEDMNNTDSKAVVQYTSAALRLAAIVAALVLAILGLFEAFRTAATAVA